MASDSGVGKNASYKKSNVIVRQGQTAGSYGNDPGARMKNGASTEARELRP